MADLTINFGFRADAQHRTSKQREIQAATNAFARMIVDDVAYNMTTYAGRQARLTLTNGIRSVVTEEIGKMAMTIGHSIAITERARGPQGMMSISGGLSETARARQWRDDAYNWNRKSTGIRWGKRDPKYVRKKKRDGYVGDWWEKSGSLANYLEDAHTYTAAFGPVRVIVDPPKNQQRARERVGATPRLTSTGQNFSLHAEYEIATVRVIYFGNITPRDLPSLRTENPNDARPKNNYGLAAYLRGDQAEKLLRPAYEDKSLRYVIEPFVSFYMTRAIPNAIWRRIERQPVLDGRMR